MIRFKVLVTTFPRYIYCHSLFFFLSIMDFIFPICEPFPPSSTITYPSALTLFPTRGHGVIVFHHIVTCTIVPCSLVVRVDTSRFANWNLIIASHFLICSLPFASDDFSYLSFPYLSWACPWISSVTKAHSGDGGGIAHHASAGDQGADGVNSDDPRT